MKCTSPIMVSDAGYRLLALVVFAVIFVALSQGAGALSAESEKVVDRYESLQDVLPFVKFKCKQRTPGYYADPRFECAVFHYCHDDGSRVTILCPRSSPVEQLHRVCRLRDVVSKECGHNEIFLELADDQEPARPKDTTASTVNKATDFKLPKVILRPTDSSEAKVPTTPLTPSHVSRQERISFRVPDLGSVEEQAPRSPDVRENGSGMATASNDSSHATSSGHRVAAKKPESVPSPASYSRGNGRRRKQNVSLLSRGIPRDEVQSLKSVPPSWEAAPSDVTGKLNVTSDKSEGDAAVSKPSGKALADRILYLLEVYSQGLRDVPVLGPQKKSSKAKLAVSSIITETERLGPLKGQPRRRRKRMVIKEVTARRPYAVFYAKVPDDSYGSSRPSPSHPDARISLQERKSAPKQSSPVQEPAAPQQTAIELSLDPSIVPLDVPTIPIAIRLPKKKKKQRKTNPSSRPEPQVIYDTADTGHHQSSLPGRGGSDDDGHDVSEQQNVFYYAPPSDSATRVNHGGLSHPVQYSDPRAQANPNYRPTVNVRQPTPPPVVNMPGYQRNVANDGHSVRSHRQNVPANYHPGVQQPQHPGRQQRQHNTQQSAAQPGGPVVSSHVSQYQPASFPGGPAQSPFFPGPSDFLDGGFQSLGSPFGLTSELQSPPQQRGPPAQQPPRIHSPAVSAAVAPQGPSSPGGSTGQHPSTTSSRGNVRGSPASQQLPVNGAGGPSPPRSVLSAPTSFGLAPNSFPSSFFEGFPSLSDFSIPFLQQGFQTPSSFGYAVQERPQANSAPQQQPYPPSRSVSSQQSQPQFSQQVFAPANDANSAQPMVERRPTRRPAQPTPPSASRYHSPSYLPSQPASSHGQMPSTNVGASAYRQQERPRTQTPPPAQASRPSAYPRAPEPQSIAVYVPVPRTTQKPRRKPPTAKPPSAAPVRPLSDTVVTHDEYFQAPARPNNRQVASHQSYVSPPPSPRPYVSSNQQRPPMEDSLRYRQPPSSLPQREHPREEPSTRPPAVIVSRYRHQYDDYHPSGRQPPQDEDKESNRYSSSGGRNPYNMPSGSPSRPDTSGPDLYQYQAERQSYHRPTPESPRSTAPSYVSPPTESPKEKTKYAVLTDSSRSRRPSGYGTERPPPLRSHTPSSFDDSRLITDNYVDVITLVDARPSRPRTTSPRPRVRVSDNRNRYRYTTDNPATEAAVFYPLPGEGDGGDIFYATRAPVSELPPAYRVVSGGRERSPERSQRPGRTRYRLEEEVESPPIRDRDRDRRIRYPGSSDDGRIRSGHIKYDDDDGGEEGDIFRNIKKDEDDAPHRRTSRNRHRNRYITNPAEDVSKQDSRDTDAVRYSFLKELGDRNSDRHNRSRYRGRGDVRLREDGRDRNRRPASYESIEDTVDSYPNEKVRGNRYREDGDKENRIRISDSLERGQRGRYEDSGQTDNRTRYRGSRNKYRGREGSRDSGFASSEEEPGHTVGELDHSGEKEGRRQRTKPTEDAGRYPYREIVETTAVPPTTTQKPTPKMKPLPPRPTFPPFPTFPPPPPPPPPRKKTTRAPEPSTTDLPTTNDVEDAEPPTYARKRLNTRPHPIETSPDLDKSSLNSSDELNEYDFTTTTVRPTRRPRKRTRVRQRRPKLITTTELSVDVDSQESVSSYVDKQSNDDKPARRRYQNRRVSSTTAIPSSSRIASTSSSRIPSTSSSRIPSTVPSTEASNVTPDSSHSEEFGNRIKLFGRPRTRKPALFTSRPPTTTPQEEVEARQEVSTERPRRKVSKRRRPYKKRRRYRTTTTPPVEEETSEYTESIARSDEDSESLWFSTIQDSHPTTPSFARADSMFSEVSTEPYNDFITTMSAESRTETPAMSESSTESAKSVEEDGDKVELVRKPKPLASRKRLLNFGRPRLRPSAGSE